MFSLSHSVRAGLVAGVAFVALSGQPSSAFARELRVCSDSNNLPFSNANGEGFENKIAELVAADLHADLKYYWFAQRRGFIRNTLNAHNCDVVIGIPVRVELVRPTKPYYESGYVFVQRADAKPIESFDDPRLKDLKIGVQLTGNNGVNTPPAHELADRGMVNNIHGYLVYGDYSKPTPLKEIIDGVAKGDTDVAVVWGPEAGWLAAQETVPLQIHPVADAKSGIAMSFKIGMGVRKDDKDFADELQQVIDRHQSDIDAILAAYHVPHFSIPLKAETTP